MFEHSGARLSARSCLSFARRGRCGCATSTARYGSGPRWSALTTGRGLPPHAAQPSRKPKGPPVGTKRTLWTIQRGVVRGLGCHAGGKGLSPAECHVLRSRPLNWRTASQELPGRALCRDPGKGGQVRYWQHGPIENLPDLPIADLSPFSCPPFPVLSRLQSDASERASLSRSSRLADVGVIGGLFSAPYHR